MTPTAKQRVAPRRARTPADLKAQARAWAEKIGVAPRRIQVQVMRTKWASCSSVGTVTFSTDLLREDAGFQEFVLVHELLHLIVPNHGRVFRGLMRAYVPEWETIANGRTGRNCGFSALPTDRQC